MCLSLCARVITHDKECLHSAGTWNGCAVIRMLDCRLYSFFMRNYDEIKLAAGFVIDIWLGIDKLDDQQAIPDN